jgi:hypothetical protein
VGFFRDQYELLAPVLTALALVFGDIAVYGMTQSKSNLFWGALGCALISASQAWIGWRQRRRRGDDKWAPL